MSVVFVVPVQAETVSLTTFENNPFSQVSSRIITEAYRRAGYDVNILYLPGRRAIQTASSGKVDGEVSRIYEIGALYPDLIRVEVPYMRLRGMAFGIKKHIHIQQKSDLWGYRLGSLRGAVFSDMLTEGMDVTFINSPGQLLKLLVRDRLDIIVTNEIETMVAIAEEYPDAGIVALGPPLVDVPIYHYIHKSKAGRVDEISRILKTMVETGKTRDIKEAYFREHGVKAE